MADVYQMQEQDLPAFYALARYAFNKPQSPARDATFKSLFTHSSGWATGEPLSSGLLGTHFTVDLAGTAFKMSGVGYVASYPEASGHGGIGAIMRQAFADMRENGETLSYLAPFSATFYRRFGYENAFEHAIHSIAARDLPKVPVRESKTTVTRLSYGAAIPAMAEVYSRNRNATRGGLRREDWWWLNVASHYPARQVAVAALGDHPVGYVVFEKMGTTFRVHELFYDDLDALLALGRFVTAHRSAFSQFEYEAGDAAGLHDLLPEPGVLTTQLVPFMMARIVDVADFLQRYPYQVSDLAPVVIGIKDDYVPENNASWELAIDDGRVHLAKTDQQPAVVMTEQQLVKASFGVRPLREAYQLGLVDGDAFAAANLSDVFMQTQGQLYDYF
ncbi:GNAT family N-acetyltransferase [Lacticaseibacillus mingshuiensis]|uniref:GNAT family N-acetyltransferase n=1 Tax=Lacticaseibacillus mingshuiensis TaxID=2799574 RepID=UPI0019507E8B|nr:GNAT family N-acetyltransferase [Lacticaseibacillus mingshuiensis]